VLWLPYGPTVGPGTYIYDTNALGYFIHPEFATSTKGIWIDIHNTFDANYGQSIPYTSNPVPSINLLQESTVVFAINTTEFYAFYVDLLTRPVPVKFLHQPPSQQLDD
jgi:purine nucleosidase